MLCHLSDLFYYAILEWEISQARKRAELEAWDEFWERLESRSVLGKPLPGDKTNQSQPDQNSSSPE